MAVDTIKLKAYITPELASEIQNSCVRRMAIDCSTGDLQYMITTGQLEGTYDSRISIRLDRDIECFITVECSIHKIILGHNVYGGSEDLQAMVSYLHGKLQELLSVDFPYMPSEWMLMRIDLAEIYDLNSFEAVQDWIKGLNSCQFPRRVVQRYGSHGIAAYGRVTGLKIYHKGPDFWAHDRKRLKDCNFDVDELQERANKILRVEVEIKGRKLKDMNGQRYPLIGQVSMEELAGVYDREVKRFLKEGESDMNLVRNTVDVRTRLFQLHSESLASSLLATWYQLTTVGEETVKEKMKKSKYYNHIKYLKQAGVSWHGTDIVMLEDTLVPKDFSPVRTDIRRVSGEASELQEKLRPYRIAEAV